MSWGTKHEMRIKATMVSTTEGNNARASPRTIARTRPGHVAGRSKPDS
ncbi:MAG: hypothetical protein JO329_10470 [Planctomycetaceae bacterium]|nr:hypothetical protein [Planctomycetaceae bacterium]MBV8381663.1 hypothetical protein [Planctomycetaceae bacterium]MBV8555032.1 hypothetical protein [Planctomycetaceae bacterium]